MVELRPDQQRVKSEIYRSINQGKKRVVVQAMTSFGKTALAASIVHDARKKGVGVIFTAPLITLVEQTVAEFRKFGIPVSEIGVIQANHFMEDLSKPIQVCSIQSIASLIRKDRDGWLEYIKGKLLIHDETHLMYQAHKDMNDEHDMPVIGLSATPWRKEMGLYYDDLILGPDTHQLIEDGSLSKYVAYSHYIPDMKGVKLSRGDFSQKESGEKYDAQIIGDIVKTWEKYAKHRKTILFAPRVVDAERFAAEFRDAGYMAVSVSGYMDKEDCAAEVERFRDGEVTILCSVAKLSTGFSVKDVGCIVDAQPTRSLMRHIQKLGRGLRTHPLKENVIILDNAGNLIRNGLPDGEYPAELDDSVKSVSDVRGKEEALPKPCTKCNFMKPPKTHKCPACGFAPEKKSELEVEAGELVEMKPEKANRLWSWKDKARFYGGLKGYAMKHQYSDGWAKHTYKDRFGVWPNDKRLKNAPPVEPNDMVKAFITHKMIKYRNGRKAK